MTTPVKARAGRGPVDRQPDTAAEVRSGCERKNVPSRASLMPTAPDQQADLSRLAAGGL